MASQSFVQLLMNSQVDGTALTASVAQTTILPGHAIYTLPANTIDVIGKSFRIVAAGRMSTVVTTPGTFTFTVKVGSVNACVTTAMALNTTAQTNASWRLEWEITARAVGNSTSCTLMHNSVFMSRAVVGSAAFAAGGIGVITLPDTAPAVGTGFDSTAAQTIDLQGTWSVNSGSNSITCHQYKLYQEN